MNGFGTSPLELMACDAMLKGLCYLDEFVYSAKWVAGTATALGASATVDAQIQINSDSDFIATEMNFVSFTAVDTIIAGPDYLLTIIRSGSGREIFNDAQHVLNVCGAYANNRGPGRMPISALYQGANNITCRLQNRTAVASNFAQLSFRGFKVFYQTNADGMVGTRAGIFHAL